MFPLDTRWTLRGCPAALSLIVVGGLLIGRAVFAGEHTNAALRVAVDIGHDAVRSGATSARGKGEFLFNRRLALELVKRSKDHEAGKSLDLFVLNAGGEKLDLKERVRNAHDANADIFLSIHHDAVNERYLRSWSLDGSDYRYSDAFQGFSLFVSTENSKFEASVSLAKLIGQNLKDAGLIQTLHHAEPIAGENRVLLDWEYGIYDAPFAVLRHARIPSVLLEAGVIVNRAEETRLEDPAYRERIIGSILRALESYRISSGESRE
ncbi:MAG: N-acetylmuramoyl-L-alanine amidase family protein [Hyphomicrobiaceae bacterium]